jgi:hypothetical protein
MHHLSQTIGQTFNWSAIIQALVLVRLGQELGSESQVAKAVHDLVSAVLLICR